MIRLLQSLHSALGRAALTGMMLAGCCGPIVQAQEPPRFEQAGGPPAMDAFQKGPISITARVVRKGADGKEAVLPLFRTPVLRFQDRIELSFSGEAFDARVTEADWSIILVFLPRTVAPTEKGVEEIRLERTGQTMTVSPILVPYDSIPILFLVPDRGGRRKILADLSTHLESFRSICLKLSDLTEQRANLDRFMRGLESIRQDQSPAVYDSAVANFVKAYGPMLSVDVQMLMSRNDQTNLEKFTYLASEIRRSNMMVPMNAMGQASQGNAMMAFQGQSISGPIRATSAYISILFDVVQFFQNLWPGHKFQYVPALAKDFEECQAQLFYGDWIKTVGNIRGALVFSPCRWEDADPPGFSFEQEKDPGILRPYALLKVQSKAKSNSPFSFFGSDWKLSVTGPSGERLASLPLLPSPARQGFAVQPGPELRALQSAGLKQVMARIEGKWGFESVATEARPVIPGPDPQWAPPPSDTSQFMIGNPFILTLPSPWGSAIVRAHFRPGPKGAAVLTANLKSSPGGSCEALFPPTAGEPGPGALELFLEEGAPPILTRKMDLLSPVPAIERVLVHQGESQAIVQGKQLKWADSLVLGGVPFKRSKETREGMVFTSAKALEGDPVPDLGGQINLADGRSIPLRGIPLLPPRPQLTDLQVIPESEVPGLPLQCESLLVSVKNGVTVSMIAGTSRFQNPKLLLRNLDDPSQVKTIPPAKVSLLGRGQRLLASFQAAELFGTKGAGQLEIQVQEDSGAASPWVPLPALFMDLPHIKSLKQEGERWVMEGPSLEAVEATSTSPNAEWTPLKLNIRNNTHVAQVAPPGEDGQVLLRLYGWSGQVLRLRAPLLEPPSLPAPIDPSKAEAETSPTPRVRPAKKRPGASPSAQQPVRIQSR